MKMFAESGFWFRCIQPGA